MGFNTSWVATQMLTADELVTTLGAKRTGGVSNVPDAEMAVCELDNGWNLVIFDRADASRPLHQGALAKVDAVCFHAIDSVMSTALDVRTSGEEFSFDYNSERATFNTSGSPTPAGLDDLIAKAEARHADGTNGRADNRYDVAAEAAYQLVGFRHDRSAPGRVFHTIEIPQDEIELESPVNMLVSIDAWLRSTGWTATERGKEYLLPLDGGFTLSIHMGQKRGGLKRPKKLSVVCKPSVGLRSEEYQEVHRVLYDHDTKTLPSIAIGVSKLVDGVPPYFQLEDLAGNAVMSFNQAQVALESAIQQMRDLATPQSFRDHIQTKDDAELALWKTGDPLGYVQHWVFTRALFLQSRTRAEEWIPIYETNRHTRLEERQRGRQAYSPAALEEELAKIAEVVETVRELSAGFIEVF